MLPRSSSGTALEKPADEHHERDDEDKGGRGCERAPAGVSVEAHPSPLCSRLDGATSSMQQAALWQVSSRYFLRVSAMASMTASLAPDFLSSTNASVDRSKRQVEARIFLMITLSDRPAPESLMISSSPSPVRRAMP